MTDIATAYLNTWNETDPHRRAALLAEHWSADARYVDPLATATGRQEIDATIAAVQAQFTGFVFTALGDADGHHAQTRFRWGLGPDGGEAIVEGFDVVVTDDDGRIVSVFGFLDKVPAA